MNHVTAAAHQAASGIGSEVMAGIVIVTLAVLVLVIFGFRPLKSRPVRQSPAASAARATGRGAARVAARARNAKSAQQLPDDAA